MSARAVVETHLHSVPLLFRGKVRDVYDLGDAVLLVATDRISAFDVVMPTPIPGKGELLTAMSLFWFRRVGSFVEHHVLDRPLDSFLAPDELDVARGRSTVGRKTEPLRVEAVVRGYLAGSGWAEYRERGMVCGVRLPAGLRESEALPEPIFTPATKAERGEHDENITFDQMVAIVGGETAEFIRSTALRIYRECAAYAAERGILIADTKFEFGRLPDGRIILIDELLTPDSSRFWDAERYEPGKPQDPIDKQFLRNWLLQSGWDRKPPAPELPPDVVEQTAARYREALERLTGPAR